MGHAGEQTNNGKDWRQVSTYSAYRRDCTEPPGGTVHDKMGTPVLTVVVSKVEQLGERA